MGDVVLGDVHLGDWGTQMGQVILEIKQPPCQNCPTLMQILAARTRKNRQSRLADLEEIYPAASKQVQRAIPHMPKLLDSSTAELQNGRPGYRALWQHIHDISVAGLKAKITTGLDIHFDLWLGESDVQDLIEPMIANARGKRVRGSESKGALVVEHQFELKTTKKRCRR